MTTDFESSTAQMQLQMKAMAGKDIAGGHDLSLLKDATIDDYKSTSDYYPVFAVGVPDDRSAGILRTVVSPWFKTELKAWAWCFDNREFLAGMFEDVGGLTL